MLTMLAAVLLVPGVAVQAEVFKCKGTDGKVVFSDHACAADQTSSSVPGITKSATKPVPPAEPTTALEQAKRQQVQARLQAEVALRTAMENSVTIGLRAWDLAGRVLYVNDAFCSMVGYPAERLVGVSAPMPYWPQGNDSHIEQVHRDVLAHGTSMDGVEVQFQHRDGHLLDVLIHEAPLHTADGEHIGWMSSVLDISERKRMEADLADQFAFQQALIDTIPYPLFYKGPDARFIGFNRATGEAIRHKGK